MTIVFNEVDRNRTARYKVTGCEKVIVVRGSGIFSLDILTERQLDPHHRELLSMTITQNQDVCLAQFPCVACGMDLIFRTDSATDPQAHVFVEILDDTCAPEKCCAC